jgi:hypothetical protein
MEGCPLTQYYHLLRHHMHIPNAYVATKLLAEVVLQWAQHQPPTVWWREANGTSPQQRVPSTSTVPQPTGERKQQISGVKLAFVRPTLITCTYKEPETGFSGSAVVSTCAFVSCKSLCGYGSCMTLILLQICFAGELLHTLARGAVDVVKGHANVHVDLVPADAVVNMCLSAAAFLHNPTNSSTWQCQT